MTNDNDRRLIEDYLPIEAISAEASREKSVRKGHISTLHLWWARRPLVACRAAVYGALVPAPASKNGRGPKSDFVKRLCKYPGDPKVIAEAQRHILEAHAERLSKELGKLVTVKAIEEGKAPRPKVLDMFAGGGAIPLEALRLGCDAYALELNPVAHIIELCTLVYPQKYGKPDKNTKGSAPDGTWAGLAKEVEYWGKWVLERVKTEIGDLYPPIPDPKNPPQKLAGRRQEEFGAPGFEKRQPELASPGGYLTPVAYLWTRTVRCKNPTCGATVPLVRQTWLGNKPNRCVALEMVAPPGDKRVRFRVVEVSNERELGFDPAAFSKGGNATCPFCGTVADDDYVQDQGRQKLVSEQLMAVACTRPGSKGKIYLSESDLFAEPIPRAEILQKRLSDMLRILNTTIPGEPVNPTRPSPNARGLSAATRHGFTTFGDLFSLRQKLCLVTMAAVLRDIETRLRNKGCGDGEVTATLTCLGLLVDRVAEYLSSFNRWDNTQERVVGVFGRQALAMVWDYAELVPLVDAVGGWNPMLDAALTAYKELSALRSAGVVTRGSATALPYPNSTFDAVITDPPYYDNVPYADISDFFYVWLKRTVGHLHPEHFSTELTPKKSEATALSSRHNGNMTRAREEYEALMLRSLQEASRVLKPSGECVIVYAHKTTLGWSSLVQALRKAGFMVVESWPLDTEQKQRLLAMDTAALASSIFLVARKREDAEIGDYDAAVRPDLDSIVRERVQTLWEHGVSGADLVIAAVGAGLRAFTRFARVEYSNGEEVPAERFLAEVEGVVLETLLEKIFGLVGAKVSAVDGPSQFYVLWRYAYHAAELEAGEAIVFTYGLPVELDGPRGLSGGSRALVEKKKNKYRLRDFTERGDEDKLGVPSQDGSSASLIDVLHRVLYLTENQPAVLSQFLSEAKPDLERLRLVANALAGPHLKGAGEDTQHVLTTPIEQSTLGKLVANWRTVIEGHLTSEERSWLKRRLPGL